MKSLEVKSVERMFGRINRSDETPTRSFHTNVFLQAGCSIDCFVGNNNSAGRSRFSLVCTWLLLTRLVVSIGMTIDERSVPHYSFQNLRDTIFCDVVICDVTRETVGTEIYNIRVMSKDIRKRGR